MPERLSESAVLSTPRRLVNAHSWRTGWLAVLLIFMAAFYLIHSIPLIEMRDDEEIAFRTTRQNLAYAINYQAEQDVHAPIWFASFWIWQQFMGDSEYLARVYGVFLTILTLAVVYQIGRRWFKDPRFGLFAIIVLAANSYFFLYSLEIRPYSAVMLASTLSMLAFRHWLVRRNWPSALLYGVSLAVLMYLHYFTVFLIAIQAVYLLLFVRPNRTLLKQALGAAALAFLLWLPWFPIFINQIRKLASMESSFGNARGLAGIGSTTEPTTLDAVMRLLNVMTSGQIGLYALVLLAGLVLLWRIREYRLLLLWGIGVPILALVTNLVLSVYTPRYIAYLVIGFSLAIGAFFARLHWRGLVLLVAFAGVSLWSLPSQLPRDRIPHRAIFQSVSRAAQPGDAIFFDKAGTDDNLVTWQLRHYLASDLLNSRVTSVEDALSKRRVWFVTQRWFDEDVKAHFAALEFSHPVQAVFGDCGRSWCYLAQLMEAPPWSEPQRFGEDMTFWGADITTVSSATIETHLWWRLAQPPVQDYSMSLRLLDSAGAVVAQTDGAIQHYGQETVQTSQMQPNKIYIDFRTITLPQGLSPGTYQLSLVVYDWQSGQRLLMPDGSDNLLLDSVTVPTP